MGLIKTIKSNLSMMRLVLKNIPVYFFMNLIQSLMWSVMIPFNSVYALKKILDFLEKGESFDILITFILVVILINVVCYLYSFIFNRFIDPKYRQILYKKIKMKLYDKAVSCDQDCVDNPSFYDNYIWAISESDSRALQVTQNFFNIITAVIQLIFILGIIANIDIILIAIMIISVLAVYFLNLKITKRSYQRENILKPLTRKREYIARTFYLVDFAKEIRLSNVKNILFEYYNNVHNDITLKYKKFGNIFFGLVLAKDVFIIIVFEAFSIFYLFYRAIFLKTITLGSFTAILNAIWQLYNNFTTLIDSIKSLKENSLYIQKYEDFMRFEPKIKDEENSLPVTSIKNMLEFKNVYFKYQNSEKYILKNINVEIKKGDKIAIVGHNGAGKSTLIKLMLRLYDPVLGDIVLDNNNIKNLKIKDYRNIFSSVMQNCNIYSCTLEENVSMDTSPNDEKVIMALKESGFEDKLNKMNQGIKSVMLKEFDDDGILLSGGECQKVALARAFYSNNDIIILDEPSSALDPISEYNLNQKMKELAEDKTVIFISHRLSSTRMADKIFMIENGEIIEQGSHNELMNLNGKYAQMFNMQAENYREETA